MRSIIQSGTHPDADLLSAFAEQLVTPAERQEILDHMAACGTCREVVFLAQKAGDADQQAIRVTRTEVGETAGKWLSSWRWAWIPVAALAGVVGFAVVQHMRHGPNQETRMAQSAGPPAIVQSTPRAPASAPAVAPSSRIESEQKPAKPARSDRDTEPDHKSFDKDVVVTAKKEDEASRKAEVSNAAPAQASSDNVQARFEARAKSSGVGGPLLQNQVQAQNNAQIQQNYTDELRRAGNLADSANKPAASKTESGVGSDAMSVRAAGALSAPGAAAASVSETENAELSEQKVAKLRKVVLPSGLEVLSLATTGKTSIAIDTAGTLFRSEDSGRHWEAIRAQWSGRIVLVKSRPPALANEGLLKQSTPVFELTTDNLESWISTDGKTWKLQTPTSK